MSSVNTLKSNLIYNILYQILVLIVPLITAPYISRVIGSEGLGIYGYSFSIAHYFVIFIMLGIINYGNREISIIKNDIKERTKVFWNIYINQLFMGCILLILYVLYIKFSCTTYKVVFLLQSFYVISAILDISWFYFGIEQYKLTTCISSINKILSTICIFLFVRAASDLKIYTLIIAGGTLLNNIVYWIFLPKYVKITKISSVEALKHLRPILILFLPVIAINIYRYISKIILGSISDISAVGIYDAAEKFVNLPLGIIAAVGTVMLSRISRLTTIKDYNSIKRYNHLSMVVIMIISIGVTFGLAGVSGEFIPFFYGSEFSESSNVLLLLLPSILMISWSNVIRNQFLLPNRKDTLYCISVFVGAVANVILNFLLIPKYGVIGAAISTTLTEFLVCLIQSLCAYKQMDLLVYAKDIFPYLIFGFVMYMIIIQIHSPIALVSILLKIIVGLCVYTLLSFLVFRRKIKTYN